MGKRAGPRQAGQPWTVDELAEKLRVSAAHVYAMINAKNIRAVRIGATIRIPDSEAQRLCGTETVAA